MSHADADITAIRPTRRELDEIAVVAARAFQLDPFFEFLMPSHTRRARGLALFFRAFASGQVGRARVFVARRHRRILGAAVWVEPERYPLPAGRQVQQAAGALRALATRPIAIGAAARYLLAIDRAHPKEPLWYLSLLVVDPSVQRGGIGSRLQHEVMDEADRAGVDCYLETQKADNVAYYRRFGYEIAEELHPVVGGPPLWTMRRPAKG